MSEVATLQTNERGTVHAREQPTRPKLRLQVIVCSTRPGRLGPMVGRWFCRLARASRRPEIECLDLKDYALPLFDEPAYPLLHEYQHAHTKRWSAAIARGDGYVFVMPEYNSSPPPSMTNAIDFLYREWNYKPCAFVCYGGLYGGLHAVQMARMQATTVKMVPLIEVVSINHVYDRVDAAGEFQTASEFDAAGLQMLDELERWATALRCMRMNEGVAP